MFTKQIAVSHHSSVIGGEGSRSGPWLSAGGRREVGVGRASALSPAGGCLGVTESEGVIRGDAAIKAGQ